MTTVLFAHERPSVTRAAAHVLRSHGFDVEAVRDGDAAAEALRSRPYRALVVDVALPRRPGYELIEIARDEAEASGRGARVVVLVASVFRKTSYKRRPARLYGADDYVELHHLGDMLPEKLARLLQLPSQSDDAAEQEATAAVHEVADARLHDQEAGSLASLIVADVVLYNGDRIAETTTLEEARRALAEDLDVAVDLMRQIHGPHRPAGREDPKREIQRAFDALMRSMGRREASA